MLMLWITASAMFRLARSWGCRPPSVDPACRQVPSPTSSWTASSAYSACDISTIYAIAIAEVDISPLSRPFIYRASTCASECHCLGHFSRCLHCVPTGSHDETTPTLDYDRLVYTIVLSRSRQQISKTPHRSLVRGPSLPATTSLATTQAQCR